MKTESEKMKILWFIGGLTVIALIINSRFVSWTLPTSGREAPQSQSQSQPQFGHILVDLTTNWSAPIYNSREAMLRDGQVLTKDLSWQVRYDGDDSKILTLPPVNAPGAKDVAYTDTWTYVQHRITPGQSITQCKYTTTRVPR